jgi:predicted AlkP superfamily phosphohydrolase/phosphomutase
LKGREPRGTVAPGEEYDRVVAAIEQALYAMKHPKTGQPLIEKVYRKDEIYWGPHAPEGPDLMFFPRDLRYCAYGDVNFASKAWFAPPHDGRSGFHRMNGVVAMHGPGVRPGSSLGAASIVDVTPTILNALGLPVPTYMDGRVLQEAFTEEYAAAHPLEYTDAEMAHGAGEQEFSEEDAEEVARRLADLGYLG